MVTIRSKVIGMMVSIYQRSREIHVCIMINRLVGSRSCDMVKEHNISKHFKLYTTISITVINYVINCLSGRG